MPPTAQRRIARFGSFEADLENRQLTKSGYRVRLQDQPFQILALLVERQGTVVTRENLKEKLWAGNTFVEFDVGLNTAIKKLRAALNDAADNPRFVETVPRVGYRFIAPVAISATSSEIASNPPSVPEGSASSSLPIEPAVVAGNDLPPAPSSSASDLLPTRHHAWVLRGGIAAAVVLLLVAALMLRKGTKSTSAAPPNEAIQAIAVLPLQNMSTDPAQEYIADGMTDEIITDLAKLAGPKVISRTSAMQYKGTHKTIPEIARDLNVGAIVEGSVERSGDRMRVRVQLIQASTDQHLWAEAYDRELRDVLGLEADLANDIAQQIQLRLTQKQQHDLATSRPLNPQAFQDYLQGRQYWAMRTDESLNSAVEYFERAIKEDPGDARSYAGLAHVYIVLPLLTSTSQAEVYSKARSAATKALALDDSLAEAHLATAEVMLNQDWDFRGAEKEFKRTLELNPNYSTGHQWYGEFLSVIGRHAEGIHELETTLALDPLSSIVHHQAGQTFQEARQYDRAITEYRQALKLNPSFYSSYESMSWALRRQGKFVESAEALVTAFSYLDPKRPNSGALASAAQGLSQAYVEGGKLGFLKQSLDLHRHYGRPAFYLARDYSELADKESALTWLMKAYRNRDAEILFVFTDPEFDPLRSDPRFQDLINEIWRSRS